MEEREGLVVDCVDIVAGGKRMDGLVWWSVVGVMEELGCMRDSEFLGLLWGGIYFV